MVDEEVRRSHEHDRCRDGDPAPGDADELARVLSFIEVHEARHGASPEPAFFLSGAGEHDRVELTEQLHAILKQVVQALSHGPSISILARDQEISTQQAAEILGLSRPTVVKLIDEGELPAHVPGAVRPSFVWPTYWPTARSLNWDDLQCETKDRCGTCCHPPRLSSPRRWPSARTICVTQPFRSTECQGPSTPIVEGAGTA